MKVLVCDGPGTGTCSLAEIPEPQVGPGLLKIRLEYSAFCATDVHRVKHGMFDPPKGFGLGHEGSGYIVEMGEGTHNSGLKVGDKVALSGYTPCGVCSECVSKRDTFCKNPMPMRPMFTEYICSPVQQVFKLPDDADLRSCCLIEPLSCAMHGMDIAQIQLGETVCLSGGGGIGMLNLLLILSKGAARVTVIEPVAAKRELALKLGASYVIDPSNEDVVARAMEITDGQGYDVVYEASGAPAAAEKCMSMVRGKGRIIFFACFPTNYNLPLNLFDLYSKEISVHAVNVTNDNYTRTVEMAGKLKAQLDEIIGLEMPLDRAVEAYHEFASSKYPKVILKCQP